MARLTWDQVGSRFYETGVDQGVLYIPDGSGVYSSGVPWNGLTTVTESPSGADSNPQYADNMKWLNLLSVEEFGGTIEAFTYPNEWLQFDGVALASNVQIGQQGRKPFGLCYRTRVGNDVDGTDHGYKLHLVYGALASPADKAFATVNDSPEAIAFSWDFTTTPVAVTGRKPTALLVIDSTQVTSGNLTALEDILYGTSAAARLPLPDEVLTLFGGSGVTVDLETLANQPTYNSGTHVVTLPSVTGIQWKINGVNKTSGAQPALTVGQIADVSAVPLAGYVIKGDEEWTFEY